MQWNIIDKIHINIYHSMNSITLYIQYTICIFGQIDMSHNMLHNAKSTYDKLYHTDAEII